MPILSYRRFHIYKEKELRQYKGTTIYQLMKTPITYYGGKQTMLKYILPLIPTHSLYTEAFCGGAAVFFAKPPSDGEVINDLNQ